MTNQNETKDDHSSSPNDKGIHKGTQKKRRRFYLRLSHRLPKGSPWHTILLIILFSTLIHGLVIWYLKPAEKIVVEPPKQKIPIKFKYTEADTKPKQISELRQKKTEAPEKADLYGYEDHKAEKQTVATKSMASSPTEKAFEEPGSTEQKIDKIVKDLKDKMTVKKRTDNPMKGKSYEQFLPNTTAMRPGQDKVTQDFMGSDFTLGSGIDVNMKAHPLMSYFSKIRQSVELAFYNISAQRVRNYMEKNRMSKMIGTSTALVEVSREGDITFVKIIDSNGHEIIDDHWQQVLLDSGPYAPLPSTWKEENLRFRYKINYGYM
jgi:outer membrane biosynthesis protein TonB